MKISVITLFPGFFDGVLDVSIVGRAVESGDLEVELIDLREFGVGTYRQVDDAPFGGGAGMVLMIGPLVDAVTAADGAHRVLMSPAGTRLDQNTLDRLAEVEHIALICGRYEGVDQRFIDNYVDEELSLGDFVLAGGEAAAAAIIEGVARLLPGVLGNPESIESESFREGLLEEPQYTRPADFEGLEVPEVLLSGHHAAIEDWRRQQREARTAERRPDLLAGDEATDNG